MATPSCYICDALSSLTEHDCKFTIFSALPLELRRIIWHKAIQDLGPNLVKITAVSRPEVALALDQRGPFVDESLPKVAYSVPVLLHVNQESRAITRKVYTPIFKPQLSGTPVYFDFDRDTLFIDGPRAILSLYGEEARRNQIYYPGTNRTAIENKFHRVVIAGNLYQWKMLVSYLRHHNFNNIHFLMVPCLYDLGNAPISSESYMREYLTETWLKPKIKGDVTAKLPKFLYYNNEDLKIKLRVIDKMGWDNLCQHKLSVLLEQGHGNVAFIESMISAGFKP